MALSKGEQDTFYENVGESIRAARLSKNYSQEDLAKYLGFKSRISVANIESAKQSVQLHTLIDIANFLKITLEELIPPTRIEKSQQMTSKLIKNVEQQMERPESSQNVLDFVQLALLKK